MTTYQQSPLKTASSSCCAPALAILKQRHRAGGSTGNPTGECAVRRKREGTLHRAVHQSASLSPHSSEVPPIVHDVLRSPGQPLDTATRAFFEPPFGHDFSGVRVHTDTHAAESARAVDALAYTVGQDVVFGAGQYAPSSDPGKRILAHELTHTLQQPRTAGAGVASAGLRISDTHDAFENEAETLSSKVVHGVRAQHSIGRGVARLQRLADPNVKPDGLLCDVLDAVPGSDEGTNLSGIEVNTAKLTAAHKKEIFEFFKKWVADGASDFIFAEGYASVDGPKDFRERQLLNWTLSCKRAIAAEEELIKLGTPPKFIITMAHGETDKFSATNLAENRRVMLSRMSRPVPPKPDVEKTSEVPTKQDVKTKTPGDIDKDGKVEKKPDIDQKNTGNKPVPVTPTTPEDTERLFSITFELDLKNNWSFVRQPDPAVPPPFLCDHGVFQLGGKLNVGIALGKSGRFVALNEPELDINLVPGFCTSNPGVTAQVNLLKFTILKNVIEADLVGILGLPDGWASGLPDFPFTGGFQGKAQFTPFGKALKIGIFGNIDYQQGVKGQKHSWEAGGGIFLGHDFDIDPGK